MLFPARGLRRVPLGDALGQSRGDRRLADARRADEEGVILGPPAQHVGQPVDLPVPSDYGVELAVARQVAQAAAELAKRPRPGSVPGAAGRRAKRCHGAVDLLRLDTEFKDARAGRLARSFPQQFLGKVGKSGLSPPAGLRPAPGSCQRLGQGWSRVEECSLAGTPV